VAVLIRDGRQATPTVGLHVVVVVAHPTAEEAGSHVVVIVLVLVVGHSTPAKLVVQVLVLVLVVVHPTADEAGSQVVVLDDVEHTTRGLHVVVVLEVVEVGHPANAEGWHVVEVVQTVPGAQVELEVVVQGAPDGDGSHDVLEVGAT